MEAEHGLLTDFLKSANTKRPLPDKVKISIENIQQVQVILLKASLKDPTPPHRLTCHFELDGIYFFPSGDRNAYIREILSEQQKLNEEDLWTHHNTLFRRVATRAREILYGEVSATLASLILNFYRLHSSCHKISRCSKQISTMRR
jgi:hypothetical protein